MSTKLHAFLHAMDRTGNAGGPLQGDRIAIKDNICTAGAPTTCGSEMLADYEPPYDATVVERILSAGGRIVGKTNMDEFGMGSTTETSAFGPTTNPVAPERVPGGSSGGSAAAVAAGEADMALGSDTGGSVRNPAAFCGVVGIKPTYGLVSRYGLIAYGHSLEQIGPIARTVEDAARLLSVIAGPDERDATCREEGASLDVDAAIDGADAPMTVGIPEQLTEGADEGVRTSFADAMTALEDAGHEVVDVELPALEHAVAAYYVLATSEASSNLARFDGVRYGHRNHENRDWNEAFAKTRREGFGEEVIRRILLGTFALSAGYHEKYYEQAEAARTWITEQFEAVFENVDAIASPTMPTTPFPRGEALDDPLQLYLADANTVPANLARLPAISVPIAPADDLPVGLQLMGPAFSESRLIALGRDVESLSR